MLRIPRRVLLLAFVYIAVLPLATFAQSVIPGQVRDESGAVMPGVTVEVTSVGSSIGESKERQVFLWR